MGASDTHDAESQRSTYLGPAAVERKEGLVGADPLRSGQVDGAPRG